MFVTPQQEIDPPGVRVCCFFSLAGFTVQEQEGLGRLFHFKLTTGVNVRLQSWVVKWSQINVEPTVGHDWTVNEPVNDRQRRRTMMC